MHHFRMTYHNLAECVIHRVREAEANFRGMFSNFTPRYCINVKKKKNKKKSSFL